MAETGQLDHNELTPWSSWNCPENYSNVKVSVCDFGRNHGSDKLPIFENHVELLDYFRKSMEVPAKPNRRLFIVEGLEPSICELLGVQLNIPPEFFLAHCDEHSHLGVVDNFYNHQSRSRYWRVPMLQVRDVSEVEDCPSGLYYTRVGRILRGSQLRDPAESTPVEYTSFVSYWATPDKKDNKSWDVVVLVDSRLAFLEHENGFPICELSEHKPRRRLYTEVVLGRTNLETTPQPYARSTFETLTNAYSALLAVRPPSVHLPTSDPFSATMIIRNLVYASWKERILRKMGTFRDGLLEDEDKHEGYIEQGLDAFKSAAEQTRQAKDFQGKYQNLLHKRRDARDERRDINTITSAFRVYEDLSVEAQTGGDEETSRILTQRNARKNDRKLWNMLESQVGGMEDDVATWIEMFAQRSTMDQTFAANRQARSAGQLTKLATVIVPSTFVASIFSMGGDFAAGERLFLVYWVISIPITLALLAWVLHEQIVHAWKNFDPKVALQKIVESVQKLRKRSRSGSQESVDG